MSELKSARQLTLSCCEARPVKSDNATLAIVDRELFDQYQTVISERASNISWLKDCIRSLDGLKAGWYSDQKDELGMLSQTESRKRVNISRMSSEYISRNPTLSPKDALKTHEAIKMANRYGDTKASRY